MHKSPIRPRLRLGVAFIATAIAAFEGGVLWQRSRTSPPGEPAATSPIPAAGVSPLIAKNVRAEFNPQSALLIGANELIRYQQSVFVELVRAVHTRIHVVGIINDDDDLDLGRELLADANLPDDAVHFITHPLDSMWLRDYGPIFTRWTDGNIRIVNGAYAQSDEHGSRRRDDAFPDYLGRVLGMTVDQMPLTIEGGNLLSNGDGLMVTTTRVIKQPENQRYSVKELGGLMQRHLGCKVWVYARELVGEPTGHADFFITFLRRNLAVVASLDPTLDAENAVILDETAATLSAQQTSMGPLRVERIPMPPRTASGQWRSYCNILLVNGILLMPSYTGVEPAMEQEARALYERLMPGWEVVTINADSLIEKRGVLHCIGIGVPGYVNVTPLLGQAAD